MIFYKRIIHVSIFVMLAFKPIGINAQHDDSAEDFLNSALDDRDSFLKEGIKNHEQFKAKALKDHEAYKKKIVQELSDWMSKPWEPKPLVKAKSLPEEKPIPPVIIPHDEPTPKPKDEPVVVSPIVVPPAPPAPAPPKPVIPPLPQPKPTEEKFNFCFYGTRMSANTSSNLKRVLRDADISACTTAVQSAIKLISTDGFDKLNTSLISQAREHSYSDWAYFMLIETFAKSYVNNDINRQKLLQYTLLLSAGYDVRLGFSQSANRLYLLAGMREEVFGTFYRFGDKRFYPFETIADNTIVMQTSFPDTRLLSAQPSGKEVFTYSPGEIHTVTVCLHTNHCYDNKCIHPAATIALSGNLNRMDFYTDCPMYMTDGNEYTRWATYCGADLSDDIRNQVYPPLRKLLEGKNKLEQANILMDFVEAFPYKYDSEVWGGDRAFFAEETLHYPYRDCEDGAILFTRLVRDLLNLPTAVIYYPGHLAAAVAFDSPVEGAYIDFNGIRYTVCDPTIYFAPVGIQMSKSLVDPTKAVLIPVRH